MSCYPSIAFVLIFNVSTKRDGLWFAPELPKIALSGSTNVYIEQGFPPNIFSVSSYCMQIVSSFSSPGVRLFDILRRKLLYFTVAVFPGGFSRVVVVLK